MAHMIRVFELINKSLCEEYTRDAIWWWIISWQFPRILFSISFSWKT